MEWFLGCKHHHVVYTYTGIDVCMGAANERRRYILQSRLSLTGRIHKKIPAYIWDVDGKPKHISYRYIEYKSNCKLSNKTVLYIQSQYLYIDAKVAICHLYAILRYPRQENLTESHDVYAKRVRLQYSL